MAFQRQSAIAPALGDIPNNLSYSVRAAAKANNIHYSTLDSRLQGVGLKRDPPYPTAAFNKRTGKASCSTEATEWND
jgi:hypothetical protein